MTWCARNRRCGRGCVPSSTPRGRLFYRNRADNRGRKAGNIADFCRRWGGRYSYFVVLDADSVMSGATLVRLVQLMEANPDAGLIQTVPRPVGGETLFARMLQFAAQPVRAAVAVGPELLVPGRRQLLGPQRDHPHRGVHASAGLPPLAGRRRSAARS